MQDKAAKKADKPVTSTTYVLSSQTKEQDKIMRNQLKFEFADNEFKAANLLVDKKSKALLNKLDQVKINLSVRFYEKITMKFYEIFNEVHARMGNVANELNEIELSVGKAHTKPF